jgi:hypothetical protein
MPVGRLICICDNEVMSHGATPSAVKLRSLRFWTLFIGSWLRTTVGLDRLAFLGFSKFFSDFLTISFESSSDENEESDEEDRLRLESPLSWLSLGAALFLVRAPASVSLLSGLSEAPKLLESIVGHYFLFIFFISYFGFYFMAWAEAIG